MRGSPTQGVNARQRNLLTRVPKSAGPSVATLVRSIFAQPDAPTTPNTKG
jgi:hypothetical protein